MKLNKLLTLVFVLCLMPLNISFAIDTKLYQVLHGDVLEVSVWGDSKLEKVITVLPDGSISFPLVGNVNVAGYSTPEIEEIITKKLKTFLPDPEVTVIVQSTAGNKVYILGKVNNPGIIPLQGPMTVLQALSVSGGFNRFADLSEIKILRGKKIMEVHYDDLIRGENLKSNYSLEAGDTILVP